MLLRSVHPSWRWIPASLGFLALSLPAAAHDVIYTIPLSAAQEVPPSGTGGTGSATITLNDETGAVSVTGSYSGLSSNQTLAHIHGPAPAGMNAVIIVTLTGTGGTSGTFSGAGTLTPAEVLDMQAGLHYINIHSMTFGAGEIRGQICESAQANTRNPTGPGTGTNPLSFACSPLTFGGSLSATVFLGATTGHSHALLIAFDSKINLLLSGGQRLLCVDLSGSGEMFTGAGLGPVAGPTALFSAAVPNDLGLCNLHLSAQAIHFGAVIPFALSNAQDLTVGY